MLTSSISQRGALALCPTSGGLFDACAKGACKEITMPQVLQMLAGCPPMGEVGHGASAPGAMSEVFANSRRYLLPIVFALFCCSASAAETIEYGERIEGFVHKFDFPLEAPKAKDRYLNLRIRLPAEPNAFPSDMDSALKFACTHHGSKYRETARQIHASDDWIIRVRFDWVTHSSQNITITNDERAEFKLSDCSRV